MAYISTLSIRSNNGEYSYLFEDKDGDRDVEKGTKVIFGNIDHLVVYFDRYIYSRDEIMDSTFDYLDKCICDEIKLIDIAKLGITKMKKEYKHKEAP